MNTIIVPGYGDTTWYINLATKVTPGWRKLKPRVHVFGWNGMADTYDAKWEAFDDQLNRMGETAIIGISAGASVALRALAEHPDKVKKVITICGPASDENLNLTKYPLLEVSLGNLALSTISADRVMTMRPIFDDVVDIEAMAIEGAQDFSLPTNGHARSIAQAMFTQGNVMAEWIQS